MCMNDWRLGRLIRKEIAQRAGAGGTILLPPNQQRVGILISCQDDGVAAINDVLDVEFDFTDAIFIPTTSPPQLFTLQSHGDLPTRKVVINSILGACEFAVYTWVMPEEYLSAGLNQFISEYARWNK